MGGKTLSQEHKAKISASTKIAVAKRGFNKEYRKKISEGVRKAIDEGRMFNDEHIANMSHKGTNYSTEHTRKLQSDSMMGNTHLLGFKFSNKSKKKMSRSQIKAVQEGRKNHLGRGIHGYRKDIGHFVRSRWEANICRIFILEGIEYEFEPCSFKLSNKHYLVDFYLPEKDLYVEVKGYKDGKYYEIRKDMNKLYPEINLKVIDKDKYDKLTKKYKSLILNWE